MTRMTRAIVPTILCLALGAGAGAWAWAGGAADEPKDLPPTPPAQQPKGTGEAIGDTVDSVVQSIKRGARTTAETVQEQYQKAKTSIHDMGVQARVYSRLHWDKDLADSKIDLEFKEGTAYLRGTIKSPLARTKAVDLARDTIGVDRVEDHLTVEPATPATRPGTGAVEKPRG